MRRFTSRQSVDFHHRVWSVMTEEKRVDSIDLLKGPKHVPFGSVNGRLPDYKWRMVNFACPADKFCYDCRDTLEFLNTAEDLSRWQIIKLTACCTAKDKFIRQCYTEKTPGYTWADTNTSGPSKPPPLYPGLVQVPPPAPHNEFATRRACQSPQETPAP